MGRVDGARPYAFAAVEAATGHADDLEATALAYDERVRDEADAVYRESAAMDRIRLYRWNGEEVPEWDRAEVERQDLIQCIGAGALRDPVLGRAMLRRQGLLEPPSTALTIRWWSSAPRTHRRSSLPRLNE